MPCMRDWPDNEQEVAPCRINSLRTHDDKGVLLIMSEAERFRGSTRQEAADMCQDWIYHNSQMREFRSPFGAVSCNQTVKLRLHSPAGEKPDYVTLRLWLEEQGEQNIAMTAVRKTDRAVVYEAELIVPSEPGLVWYYFKIGTGGTVVYYGNNSASSGGAGQLYQHEPPSYQITVYKRDSTTPDWFKDAVMYQIMPDRFYNGEPDGKVLSPKKGSLLHSHWDNTPFYIRETDSGRIRAYDFFGGNLRGIMAKLPYLKELGVTVIYLNPVFESPSNHRYDTADYHTIDAMLGDNDLFAELCAAAREYGIAIFLDGVFSHTGSDSKYFNREGRYPGPGACQSRQSPYYNWYRFRHWPDEYECWWGIDTLPNVEETESSYVDFAVTGPDSVAKYWLRQGAKGWRLDVADELPDEFIRQFRSSIKETDPDSVLIGEVWEDASRKVSYGKLRKYLGGEELDSAMNYPFRDIVLAFITGRKEAAATHQALMSLYENYPLQNFYAMMNLIGSHDVPRVLTLLGEAPPADTLTIGDQSRYTLPEDKRKLAVARLKLASLWQMTFPGVPCVYYGDEAGAQGYKDPFNRGTYPWENENKELLAWYKKVIGLRHKYDVLKTGEWHCLYAEGAVYGYVRRIANSRDVFGRVKEDGVAVILLNRSIDKAVTLSLDIRPWCSGPLIDVLQGETEIQPDKGMLTVHLQPLEGKLYIQVEEPALERGCGILLHPTSLPSRYGIGDLGKEAYEFVNFLVGSKQKLWQILPLNPIGDSDSPYQSSSAFAGNHLLISLGKLVQNGLLPASEIKGYPRCDPNTVQFNKVRIAKERLLRIAFRNFMTYDKPPFYAEFTAENAFWLDDYAFFTALKQYFNKAAWTEWPRPVARRDEDALNYYREILAEDIQYHLFLQYTFYSQWQELKRYAGQWGIRIVGDLPLFVAHDSSDVWANPQLFQLDAAGRAAKVAGVPPDYFSKTGQLWGNPLYNWQEMAKDDYKWWRDRFEMLFKMVDIVRMDHFRGFEAYWEVPAGEKTAINGQWVKGPGAAFFATMKKYLGRLPVIAEDLGVITPEVEQLKQAFHFPGMRVLHFSFNRDEEGEYVPFSCSRNTVLYTGTHDNDTTVGWYAGLVSGQPEMAELVRKALGAGEGADAAVICRHLVEFAYNSNAHTVVIPLQDLLELDSTARMNTPGTVKGNWKWRSRKEQYTPDLAARLAELAAKYGR